MKRKEFITTSLLTAGSMIATASGLSAASYRRITGSNERVGMALSVAAYRTGKRIGYSADGSVLVEVS